VPNIEAYDRVAVKWGRARLAGPDPFPERGLVERLVAPLTPGGRVLDAGCGVGQPIGQYLVNRRFEVVGLDASGRMIEIARHAVPGAHFVRGDMRTAEFARSFHAIVAWDSVFHIPRDEHRAVFTRFGCWLKPGGRLLVSLGGSSSARLTSEMLGETFSYSAFEPDKAIGIIEDCGFDVESCEIDDPSSGGHIAVLAVRVEA